MGLVRNIVNFMKMLQVSLVHHTTNSKHAASAPFTQYYNIMHMLQWALYTTRQTSQACCIWALHTTLQRLQTYCRWALHILSAMSLKDPYSQRHHIKTSCTSMHLIILLGDIDACFLQSSPEIPIAQRHSTCSDLPCILPLGYAAWFKYHECLAHFVPVLLQDVCGVGRVCVLSVLIPDVCGCV